MRVLLVFLLLLTGTNYSQAPAPETDRFAGMTIEQLEKTLDSVRTKAMVDVDLFMYQLKKQNRRHRQRLYEITN